MALERDGAALTAPDGLHAEAATAITASELAEPFDLVIVAVKASAITAVVDEIAPAIGSETIIVPLLNGMRHIDRLEAGYPGRVAGGLAKIVASLDDRGGAVQMTSLAEITIGSLGSAPLPNWVGQTLDVPGLAVVEAIDVRHNLWEKWAFIASAGIITCLFDNAVGNVQEAGGLSYIHDAVREAEAVATAAGYPPREAAHAQSLAILTEPGSAFTSSLYRDLTTGKVTEAEHILGDLASRARHFGVDIPLLDLTLVRVRAAELSRVTHGA